MSDDITYYSASTQPGPTLSEFMAGQLRAGGAHRMAATEAIRGFYDTEEAAEREIRRLLKNHQ